MWNRRVSRTRANHLYYTKDVLPMVVMSTTLPNNSGSASSCKHFVETDVQGARTWLLSNRRRPEVNTKLGQHLFIKQRDLVSPLWPLLKIQNSESSKSLISLRHQSSSCIPPPEPEFNVLWPHYQQFAMLRPLQNRPLHPYICNATSSREQASRDRESFQSQIA